MLHNHTAMHTRQSVPVKPVRPVTVTVPRQHPTTQFFTGRMPLKALKEEATVDTLPFTVRSPHPTCVLVQPPVGWMWPEAYLGEHWAMTLPPPLPEHKNVLNKKWPI